MQEGEHFVYNNSGINDPEGKDKLLGMIFPIVIALCTYPQVEHFNESASDYFWTMLPIQHLSCLILLISTAIYGRPPKATKYGSGDKRIFVMSVLVFSSLF